MKKVLTIAGSDCSGGAGIQADLKTITAHRLYGMSVITALTAQNTTGVQAVQAIDADFVGAQLDAVFSDIIPDAVKIGMVANKEIIQMIARKMQQYKVRNIVLDPVMAATAGSKLLQKEATVILQNELMPLASIITPNIGEAAVLAGFTPTTTDEMEKAAKIIYEKVFAKRQDDCAVLVKGGHLTDSADDVLCDKNLTYIYNSRKIDNKNTHGTGCTLSSAIACNLAEGFNLQQSVKNAKKYVTMAMQTNLDLGSGAGPLNHMAAGGWLSSGIWQ